jgi:hypothetical protein
LIAVERLLKSEQKAFIADYRALVLVLVAKLSRLLLQNSDADGIIPLRQLETVQNQAQSEVLALFVDPVNGPYEANGVTPRADYPRILNRHIVAVTIGVLNAHRGWLQRNTPSDVFQWMQLRPAGYGAKGPFRSNPLAEYDPFYKWIAPNGYVLSERIWQTALETRNKLGEYLDWNIRRGTSALRMSRELEQFLIPGREKIRTNRPYGTWASYDGMRLARTEIARAHAEATFRASLANPYVRGMDWKLSASHPKVDICDRLATIGMSGERIKEAYPLETAPQVVTSSHPQCLCTNIPATADNETVTSEIKRLMEEESSPPYSTPANVLDFAIGILGAEMLFQIREALAA